MTEHKTKDSNKTSSSNISLGLTESASETSLNTDDDEVSEPFLKEYASYDGRDKRATDRYDIGLDILKALIECGTDPEIQTHGRSALMFSVLAKDFSFVKRLVELGANVNRRNEMGETALSLALEDPGREEIAEYLKSK